MKGLRIKDGVPFFVFKAYMVFQVVEVLSDELNEKINAIVD